MDNANNYLLMIKNTNYWIQKVTEGREIIPTDQWLGQSIAADAKLQASRAKTSLKGKTRLK